MPSRRFCDICDNEIKDTEDYYSVNITAINTQSAIGYSRYNRNQVWDEDRRTHLNIDTVNNMVCEKCTGNIRLRLERLRDALQVGQATEVLVRKET